MTIASARSHFYATLPNVSPVPTFPFLLFYAFFFLLFPPSPLSRQFIFATARSSLIGLRFLVHNFRVTSVVDNDGRCGLISGDRWKCTRVNDRSNIIDRHFSFFPPPSRFPSAKDRGRGSELGSTKGTTARKQATSG